MSFFNWNHRVILTQICIKYLKRLFVCFICLFVCVFRNTREFFTHMEMSSLPVKGRLQMLTYTRHSWPFSSEDSLACHTYCDTGHPFIWSSPRTRNTHICCRAFGSGTVTTCFYDLGLSRLGFEH